MAATGFVVVAAGTGERLGGVAPGPKALVEIAGRPLLDLALDRVLRTERCDRLVVVHTPGHRQAFESVVASWPVDDLVPGGPTRTQSVHAGLEVLGDVATAAVHDAARPLTPSAVMLRVLDAVSGDVVAAAPGLPVPDTLKRVEDAGRVVATLDRRGVWAVHTPQVFHGATLRSVVAWSKDRVATDDLTLVEEAIEAGVVSGHVTLVRGDVRDLKITYPSDLATAAALLSAEGAMTRGIADAAAAPESAHG